MPKKVPHSRFDAPLSDKDKAELGIDNASFIKRMQARINKIRGNDESNGTENFLVRHNYYSANENLA